MCVCVCVYISVCTRGERGNCLTSESVAEFPPDVLIIESTFGIKTHEERTTREERFLSTVRRILERGGHVLLPMFALGRTQELMIMLDEYWLANPDLQSIPIYFGSELATRGLEVYKVRACRRACRLFDCTAL